MRTIKPLVILSILLMTAAPSWAKQASPDLTPLFNNDGISSEAAKGVKGLDNGGYSFPAEDLPNTKGLMMVGGVPFAMAPASAGNDNIACKGQKIKLPYSGPSKLHILGTAVNGSSIQWVTVVCKDGSKYRVDLALTDWCMAPVYNEQPGIEFSHRHASKPDTMKCRIWKQTVYLKPGKAASAIILPNNPDFHIFALTEE